MSFEDRLNASSISAHYRCAAVTGQLGGNESLKHLGQALRALHEKLLESDESVWFREKHRKELSSTTG